MEQNMQDTGYRNKDYQDRQPDKLDIELTARLIALYARTNVENDLDTPLLADDSETSMASRIAIGEAISSFFNDCKALASEERLITRFKETGMSIEEYKAAKDGNTRDYYMTDQERLLRGEYDSVSWQDDMGARLNERAMQSMKDLSNALNANNVLAALDPKAIGENTPEKLRKETRTDKNHLLGLEFDDPVKEEMVTKTFGKGNARSSYEQILSVGYTGAYDTMIGIAKTIETYNADELQASLTGSATRGKATRLLFQSDAGAAFQQAAEELGIGQKKENAYVSIV